MNSFKRYEGIPYGAYVHVYLSFPGRETEVEYVGRWIQTTEEGMLLEYGLGRTFIPWQRVIRIEALFADNPEREEQP